MSARTLSTLSTLATLLAPFSLVSLAACGDAPPRPPATPISQTASTGANANANRNVAVSDEIAKSCKITFDNADKAPKFDFDHTDLLPEDRDVLSQVAKCVTSGPLKGRALKLVGHADARGEAEYNMGLGEHRAGSVRTYLTQLGVDTKKVAETSRGELDASGRDESGWRRDRRVDIVLE